MDKPFLTYDQQLQKLKDKGLGINDEEKAKKYLQNIGYYSLITGYKSIFKNPVTRTYYYNVNIEDIVSLYEFDENLRSIFMKYILKIERKISSLLSYEFCNKYGDTQDAYLNKEHYHENFSNEAENLIDKFSRTIQRDVHHRYIIHYRRHHSTIPLWVIMNTITFGSKSVMYEIMKDDIKTLISKQYENVNESDITSMLKCLTTYRNLCAHGERFYNARVGSAIVDTRIHEKLNINKNNGQYIQGKNDLFAVVIIFKYLLPKESFKEFKKILSVTIKKFVKKK